MIVLHDLSRIQPHVNVAVCVMIPSSDIPQHFQNNNNNNMQKNEFENENETENSEIDLTRNGCEFLQEREVVLTVFSSAATEMLKLGLGSVVTLEHWYIYFLKFIYTFEIFIYYIFLLLLGRKFISLRSILEFSFLSRHLHFPNRQL